MVAWGIVMTLMGIVQSYEGLLIARIFLGVTEAGYVLLLKTTSPCLLFAQNVSCERLNS